jgi:DNA anti-recombination protein RmuC
MIMDTDVATITAIAGVLAVIISMMALVGTGISRLSRLSNQVANLSAQALEQRQDLNRVETALRAEIHVIRDELRAEIHVIRDELRAEMRANREELLAEMRRGNQLLLIALANHEHDENGHAIFTAPVGTDANGADD